MSKCDHCEQERELNDNNICAECADPTAFMPVDAPGTQKSRERTNKQNHVW